ncbi:MAG: hypothetical protein ABIL09_27520 [Gemmatimonadota bacterium]
MAARPAPKKSSTHGSVVRKVLEREDFGRCVLLPKTEWARFPEAGPAWALVDGTKRRVTVQVEDCNCQGTGWHQHRFLSLPAAAAALGSRVSISAV